MVHLTLTAPNLRCAVKDCLGAPVQRHHKGCEAMWLRHFAHRHKEQRFRDYAIRYAAFLPEDCVSLCRTHHKAIHAYYYPIIGSWSMLHGPCNAWGWTLAEKLMQRLRNLCDVWINNQ